MVGPNLEASHVNEVYAIDDTIRIAHVFAPPSSCCLCYMAEVWRA